MSEQIMAATDEARIAEVEARVADGAHPVAVGLAEAWQEYRAALSHPSLRRDVCFICETAPVQVRAAGIPVGVCRACDAASKGVAR